MSGKIQTPDEQTCQVTELLINIDMFFRACDVTENHIDIYVGSDVQPPSYLNVKDAPDHEVVDAEFLTTTTSFVDGDFNAAGKNFFSSTSSESRFELKTKTLVEASASATATSGYVNIDSSFNATLSKRRNREFGYSLSRSKSVCDISSMTQQSVDIDADSVTLSSKAVTHATLNRQTSYDVSSLASRGSKSSRVVRNRTILGSFPLFYKLSQSLSSLNTTTTTGTTTTQCTSFVADFAVKMNHNLDQR